MSSGNQLLTVPTAVTSVLGDWLSLSNLLESLVIKEADTSCVDIMQTTLPSLQYLECPLLLLLLTETSYLQVFAAVT